MASDGIYIRQYRPSDLPQIRLLIFEEASITRAAKRAFLLKPASLIAYILGGIGLGLLSLPDGWCSPAATLGALLCVTGIALFTAVRRGITQALVIYCEEALKTDLEDITTHYRAPAAFFVAARPCSEKADNSVAEGTEEVVGYVGFDYQPDKNPETAVVRRMIVSEKHRGCGIAGRTMHALLAHAETIPALQCIELGTSEYQPAAQRLYERLGWEVAWVDQWVDPLGGWLWKVQIRHFRKPVGAAASLKVQVQ
ncbi:acyl-CoA N-acyltransferase [Mycena maculata]|uniref:Acyl-CoA N-acyltransferase n=1 Tax=Mycena maculata TaxID=230809 RepID=A0AAD7IHR5_9AGAR|nr:acyl-CoA N-acyltransferase [Mycena maculata]